MCVSEWERVLCVLLLPIALVHEILSWLLYLKAGRIVELIEALEAMAKDNQSIPARAMILSRKYRTLVSSWIEPLQEEAELGFEIDYIARCVHWYARLWWWTHYLIVYKRQKFIADTNYSLRFGQIVYYSILGRFTERVHCQKLNHKYLFFVSIFFSCSKYDNCLAYCRKRILFLLQFTEDIN